MDEARKSRKDLEDSKDRFGLALVAANEANNDATTAKKETYKAKPDNFVEVRHRQSEVGED